MKKLKKILLLAVVFALLVNITAISKAARKVVSFDSIEGTVYTFDNVKGIKLSGNKVTITGTLNRILPDDNYKKITQKKFTFKISAKVKQYECEDEWYYNGKVKINKNCNKYAVFIYFIMILCIIYLILLIIFKISV